MDFSFISHLLSFFIAINTIGAIITVFREPREISATWAWLIVLVVFPGIGFILYFFIGRKLSSKRIFDLKSQESLGINKIAQAQLGVLSEKHDIAMYRSPYITELAKLFLASEQSIVTRGNQIDLITHGQDLFDQMKADLASAQHHIHMDYYIFKDDKLGQEIMDILVEQAQAGVEVLVTYDAMGSRSASRNFWKRLEAAGGQTVAFFGSSFGLINFRVNYRNHRKIIVIDGKIGYVGGFNIGDEYLGLGRLGYWRDNHLRIQGNAVLTLQSRFLTDWNAAAKSHLKKGYLEEYFPISPVMGRSVCQIVSDGPDTEAQTIKLGLIKMISMAKHYVYIQTPYFVPDESVLEALKVASLSGVDVRLMIPCKPDHMFVYQASEYFAQSLLDSGVKVYTYQNGFLHAKTIVIDDMAATVGTTNMDYRSFRLNFEISAFVYDGVFAQEVAKAFRQDLELCQEADKAYFEKQSRARKALQVFSRLLAPVL